jgi:hypothetical protein
MKKTLLSLVMLIPIIACAQVNHNKLNLVQGQLKTLKIDIDDSNIILDTVFTNKYGSILTVNDSLNVKEEHGKIYVFYSDNESILHYMGKFGDNAQLPAVFTIKPFPNQDKLIVMRYVLMEQGIVEESLTLFKKSNSGIVQIYPSILEASLANSGLCPDIEKCYEYKTNIIAIDNSLITFNKKGTYLDYMVNKIKKIDEIFYLQNTNNSWKLIQRK